MNTIEFNTAVEWQAWLDENHASVNEIWLVYYKKATGIPGITYKESLDLALCYGWVDSIIKKIDEQKYMRKFTPRKDNSKWSLVNKTRVEQLIEQGRMTEFGMAKVEAAKCSGAWDKPTQKADVNFDMPEELAQALAENPQAEAFFNTLAKSYRRQYIWWISSAKRAATKERRLAEAIRLLNAGEKLGMK